MLQQRQLRRQEETLAVAHAITNNLPDTVADLQT